MITVTEAKRIIREASTSLPPTLLPLQEATGHLLAEDIFAGQDHLHFDQAAMDGNAFRFDDLQGSTSLLVRGESAAGSSRRFQAGEREAVRIFTGAPVPVGTDTVVMQEKVFRDGDTILIGDEALQRGGNVRPAGSEIRAGDYDFVASALDQCGVEQLFHKVNQKHGKLLYFGKKGNTLVFGLPGNPSSVLTCFYEYVTGNLQVQVGLPYSDLPARHLPLAADYSKKVGLTHFLKGWSTGGEATPLSAQESYRLRSFALADCLIVLEEGKTHFQKGYLVEVQPITT